MAQDVLTDFISEFQQQDHEKEKNRSAQNRTILFVDDDPLIRGSIIVILNQYDLLFAENAEQVFIMNQTVYQMFGEI